MTDRFDEAWRAYADMERGVHAPPHLEGRVLTAVKHAQFAPPPRRRSMHVAWLVAAATVAIGVATAMTGGPDTPVVPLPSRAHGAVPLPAPVAEARPQRPVAPPVIAMNTVDWLAREDEVRIILMMFEATPSLPSEPLQLVRLRIPTEALSGLGVALFDPDTGGTVDVDVLVGEDGLPKNIRKIRVAQEER
jgi:hypothetical protein